MPGLHKHCIMVCGKKEGRGKGRRDCKKEGGRQASGLEGRKKGKYLKANALRLELEEFGGTTNK